MGIKGCSQRLAHDTHAFEVYPGLTRAMNGTLLSQTQILSIKFYTPHKGVAFA
jgi:hypothetical protein